MNLRLQRETSQMSLQEVRQMLCAPIILSHYLGLSFGLHLCGNALWISENEKHSSSDGERRFFSKLGFYFGANFQPSFVGDKHKRFETFKDTILYFSIMWSQQPEANKLNCGYCVSATDKRSTRSCLSAQSFSVVGGSSLPGPDLLSGRNMVSRLVFSLSSVLCDRDVSCGNVSDSSMQ